MVKVKRGIGAPNFQMKLSLAAQVPVNTTPHLSAQLNTRKPELVRRYSSKSQCQE